MFSQWLQRHRRPLWGLIAALAACLVYRMLGHAAADTSNTAAGNDTDVASSNVAEPARVARAPLPSRDFEPSRQSIVGWVATSQGKPLAGARVCAVCASCDISASPPGRCGASDASGKFSLEDMPIGMFVVTASLEGYQVGVANAGEPVRVTSDANVNDVGIVLTAAETNLAGLVLDALGGPIEQAAVQIAPVVYSVRALVELTTDAKGRFSASLPIGRVAIRAEAPGYAPALLYRTLPSQDATLRLAPGGTIQGTVVDSVTGKPVQGIDVKAVGTMAATLLAPTTSRADGSFSLSGVSPGRYGLVAEGEHYRGGTSSPFNVGFAELITGVVVPVTSGVSVSGRVLVGRGEQPCNEGYVQLGPPSVLSVVTRLGEPNAEPPVESSVPSVVSQIDRLGQVRLRGLSPGHYYVAIECRGHVFADGPKVLDLKEHDSDVTWRVAEGLGLVVVVKDEAGKPVPHANLSLELPPDGAGNRALMGLQVDENGRSSLIGSLYPGSYVVHPAESYGVQPVPVDLVQGGGTREVAITVPGSSSLRVQVRSARGAAVDEVQVVACAQEAEANPSPKTDVTCGSRHDGIAAGNGEFVIRPLRAGKYRVEVVEGGNPASIAAGPNGPFISLRPGEDAVATVTLECNANLSGSVLDAKGVPVADVWVTAFHERSGRADEEPAGSLGAPDLPRVLSDAEGHFALSGLCAGASYRLRAEQDGRDVGQLSQVKPRDGLELRLQPPAPADSERVSQAVDSH